RTTCYPGSGTTCYPGSGTTRLAPTLACSPITLHVLSNPSTLFATYSLLTTHQSPLTPTSHELLRSRPLLLQPRGRQTQSQREHSTAARRAQARDPGRGAHRAR